MESRAEPFYIEVKYYDLVIRIEKPNSDQHIDNMVDMFRSMLLAMGYSNDSINEYLGE